MTHMRNQGGAAFVWWLIGLAAAAALLFALYIWLMLSWSYSAGERAGWVQKLSKKGFLCKTWEGEMVMVSLPGSVPEKFVFTVWDDATAAAVNQVMGKRVALQYEEHIGLPTSCFGDTRHFVKAVKVIEEVPGPLLVPSQPGTTPAPAPAGSAQPSQSLPPEQPRPTRP